MSLESIAKQLPKAAAGMTLPFNNHSPSADSLAESPVSSTSASPSLLSSPELNDHESGSRLSYQFSPEEYRYYYEQAMNGGVVPQPNNSTTRMIEQLQTTIDTLRRDLNLQTEKAKEERRAREAVARKFEANSEQTQVIRHQNDMFNKILERKDRKIQELEKKAETESKLRLENEKEMKLLSQRLVLLEREAAKDKEMRLQSENSYETLVTSTKHANIRLRDEVNSLKSDIKSVVAIREGDLQSFKELESRFSDLSGEKQNLENIQKSIKTAGNEQIQVLRDLLCEMQGKVDKSISTDGELLDKVNSELQKAQWMNRNASS